MLIKVEKEIEQVNAIYLRQIFRKFSNTSASHKILLCTRKSCLNHLGFLFQILSNLFSSTGGQHQ